MTADSLATRAASTWPIITAAVISLGIALALLSLAH